MHTADGPVTEIATCMCSSTLKSYLVDKKIEVCVCVSLSKESFAHDTCIVYEPLNFHALVLIIKLVLVCLLKVTVLVITSPEGAYTETVLCLMLAPNLIPYSHSFWLLVQISPPNHSPPLIILVITTSANPSHNVKQASASLQI